MRRLIGLLLVVLLAAFSASTVARAAESASMHIAMAAGGADLTDMAGCGEWDSVKDAKASSDCDAPCTLSATAIVGMPTDALSYGISAEVRPMDASSISGRKSPPDPFPPRSTVLI